MKVPVSDQAPTRRYGEAHGHGTPPAAGRVRRQAQLPSAQVVRMAWRNIRHRLGRSILVVAGIVLALAFLTYILCSDAIARNIATHGPAELLERLHEQGSLVDLGDADARAQTWWMVGLAMMVSFVGILNAMLLSVTERFAEIGTMKCLGALDGLIVRLFLLESAFEGLLGTALGIAIGLGGATLEWLVACGSDVWTLIPYGQIALLVGVCLTAGVLLTVFGALYPAWRAARMRPVDAMRLEV